MQKKKKKKENGKGKGKEKEKEKIINKKPYFQSYFLFLYDIVEVNTITLNPVNSESTAPPPPDLRMQVKFF